MNKSFALAVISVGFLSSGAILSSVGYAASGTTQYWCDATLGVYTQPDESQSCLNPPSSQYMGRGYIICDWNQAKGGGYCQKNLNQDGKIPAKNSKDGEPGPCVPQYWKSPAQDWAFDHASFDNETLTCWYKDTKNTPLVKNPNKNLFSINSPSGVLSCSKGWAGDSACKNKNTDCFMMCKN